MSVSARHFVFYLIELVVSYIRCCVYVNVWLSFYVMQQAKDVLCLKNH